MLFRFEVGVRPHRAQLGVADVIGVGGLLDVHRVAHRRQLAGLGVGLAVVGPGHIVDLLEAVAALVVPALDDLDPVEVATLRDLSGPRRRRSVPWRAAFLGRSCPMGTPPCVGLLHEVLVLDEVLRIAPAAEEPQADQRTRSAVGLLALDAVEDGFAGIFRGPDTGGTGGAEVDRRLAGHRSCTTQANLGGVIDVAVHPGVVELLVGRGGDMGICATRQCRT